MREQAEEEKPVGRKYSVGKEKANIIDQGGCEMIRRPRPRRLGQYMPDIIAVDAERPGESITKELSKKKVLRRWLFQRVV